MERCPQTLIYAFHESSLAAAIDLLRRDGAMKVVHWIGVNSPSRSFDEDIHAWHLDGITESRSVPSTETIDPLCQQIRDEHGERFGALGVGLGIGLLLHTKMADVFPAVFLYWLLVFYLVVLGLEVWLLVRQPPAGPDAVST